MESKFIQSLNPNIANKLINVLEKRNKLEVERLKKESQDPYKEYREAKTFSKSLFDFGERYREEKLRILENNPQAVTPSLTAFKNTIFNEENKGTRMKAVGGTLSVGALHTLGIATGNPLFNLLASGLSQRNRRIIEAKRNINKFESSENKDLIEQQEKTNEKLDDIYDVLDETKNIYSEALEDKALTTKTENNIVKSAPAKQIIGKHFPNLNKLIKKPETNNNIVGEVLTANVASNLMTKILPTILPFVGTALATLATGGLISIIAAKAFPKIDEALNKFESSRSNEHLISQINQIEQNAAANEGYLPGDEERLERLKAELSKRGFEVKSREVKKQGFFDRLLGRESNETETEYYLEKTESDTSLISAQPQNSNIYANIQELIKKRTEMFKKRGINDNNAIRMALNSIKIDQKLGRIKVNPDGTVIETKKGKGDVEGKKKYTTPAPSTTQIREKVLEKQEFSQLTQDIKEQARIENEKKKRENASMVAAFNRSNSQTVNNDKKPPTKVSTSDGNNFANALYNAYNIG